MFDHEKLDVYQASLLFVSWVYQRVDRQKGHFRHARDELIRASQSIPRNIAEGNGKSSLADRGRFFEIARGSALECAAILDELQIMKALEVNETIEGKKILHRIVNMLTKMLKPVQKIREDSPGYSAGSGEYDYEHDYEHEHE